MTRRDTLFRSSESRADVDTAIPPYYSDERNRVLAVLARWEAEVSPEAGGPGTPARAGR